MHAEVLEYVRRFGSSKPLTVLDIGGRDLNGTSDELFPNALITVLDIRTSDRVDIVADAATWIPNQQFDVVLCTEVFEHTKSWPAICLTAYAACRFGGQFIVTCAGPKRGAHSGYRYSVDLDPDEWYQNVDAEELRTALISAGFISVTVESTRDDQDLHAVAYK